jgi:hypothetical protein
LILSLCLRLSNLHETVSYMTLVYVVSYSLSRGGGWVGI